MIVYALELEYEDVTGESHFELRSLYETHDDALWYWTWHVSDADKKSIYKNYRISKWTI